MTQLRTIINKKTGFTLIEIMVVVFIISMLCMIAIPSWIRARERSYTKTCIAQLRQVRTAKEEWAMEYKMNDSATPSWDQILVYVKSRPACPAGGDYTIGSVADEPICSYGNDHVIQ